jgi:hypothetical protein
MSILRLGLVWGLRVTGADQEVRDFTLKRAVQAKNNFDDTQAWLPKGESLMRT